LLIRSWAPPCAGQHRSYDSIVSGAVVAFLIWIAVGFLVGHMLAKRWYQGISAGFYPSRSAKLVATSRGASKRQAASIGSLPGRSGEALVTGSLAPTPTPRSNCFAGSHSLPGAACTRAYTSSPCAGSEERSFS
jgi:hypothetical protein